MIKRKNIFKAFTLVLFFGLLISSCQTKVEVPYPENPSGFEIPKAIPFKITDGKPISWKEIPKDSVPIGRVMRFDLDRLPSKPFFLEEETPLKKPVEKTTFDWDELEEYPFNLVLENDSLESSITRLPEPIITPVITPLKLENVNAGILSLSNGQGLPGNIIFAQIISPDGIHWIATEKGLVKFTGSEFHLYPIVKSDFSGAVNTISDLDFAPDGKLIVSSFQKGIVIVDLEKELVETIELPYGFSRGNVDLNGNYWGGRVLDEHKFIDLKNRTISNLDLKSLNLGINNSLGSFIDSKNNLWLGLSIGVGVIDADRKKMKLLNQAVGLETFANYDFTETSSGEILISSFSPGLSSISLENSTITRLGAAQGFEGAPLDVKLDKEENIWIGSNQFFSIYNPKKGTIKTIETKSNLTGQGPPAVNMFDQEGMYWSGSWLQGLTLYDPSGMDSRHFTTDDGLISNDTWGISEDSKGRVWFGTYRGLMIYSPKDHTLKELVISENIGSNEHRGVTKIDDDLFFVGSFGGFSILDLNINTITGYRSNSETAMAIWRAIKRSDGSIWIATNNGLIVFDRSKGTMKKLDAFSGLASNTIWGLKEDSAQKIWLVSDSGINVIDPEKNTIGYFGILEGLPTNDQSALLLTADQRLVIGGAKGISIINKNQDSITLINKEHGLIPEGLYDMVESKGRLHLGTENGIVVIDEPQKDDPNQAWRFSNFGRAEGFPFTDYNQSTAFVTSEGKVWWGASPILTVNLQDPITNSSTDAKVEMTGIKVMDESPSFFKRYQKVEDLEMPDSLGFDKSELADYLNENNIRWDSLEKKTKMPIGLVLPHHQNSLTFLYSNPTIKSRDEIEFRYVLEGSDEAWSEITKNSTSKTYFNLLPGEYTFKVITKGFNGVWSQPASFSFTIKSPWWLTWWAFLIYMFLLGLLIYTIVQVRSFYLKKENRLLEERVQHRTAQLNKSIEELKSTQEQLIQSEKMASLGELTAGIAHEIQNPLNFVNNFSEVSNELIQEIKEERLKTKDEQDEGLIDEILADISDNLDKINTHGKRADSIVKGMLQHSRNNSGQKELTDINALADEYLRLSYHGLRAKDKSFNADFKLDLDPTLPKMEVVPQDIGRVVLNLINNGFYAVTERRQELAIQGNREHVSYKPTVWVSTKKLDKGIEIRIRDNGKGIPEEIKAKIFQPFFTTKPAGKGTGLGLSMSYEIITKGHNGQLSVQSVPGEFTEFIIILT
jgi:signal transduction histidine kinase/ligand-binding sensor domain-containing protein